jgi:hypothetical protein
MSLEFRGKKLGVKTALLIGLIIAVIILLGVWLSGCDEARQSRPVTDNDPLNCANSADIERKTRENAWRGQKTPSGAQVWVIQEIPANALQTIDRAIDYSNTVQAIQFPEWQPFPAHEWEIAFLPADGLAPQSGLPFLYHNGGMTAGTITHCNQTAKPERNQLILPDFWQYGWDKEADLFRYVFNEGEHFREYRRDRAVFDKFKGWSDQHPHRHEGKPTADELLPKTLVPRKRDGLVCVW